MNVVYVRHVSCFHFLQYPYATLLPAESSSNTCFMSVMQQHLSPLVCPPHPPTLWSASNFMLRSIASELLTGWVFQYNSLYSYNAFWSDTPESSNFSWRSKNPAARIFKNLPSRNIDLLSANPFFIQTAKGFPFFPHKWKLVTWSANPELTVN